MFRQLKKLFGRAPTLAKKHSKTLRYEELEQRVLFSADGLAGVESLHIDEQVLVEDVNGADRVGPEAASAGFEQAAESAATELVFVDPSVPDFRQLISDLQAKDANRIIEVVLLEADRDGIAQASDILARRSDLKAVHFIAHGSEGRISLGSGGLNTATLQKNSDAIGAWGNALTETGDILFYGCNIAANSDGQTLLDDIARLTGADVAASDDLTGSAHLGGDWELEYEQGQIETAVPVSSKIQQNWQGVLATFTVNTTLDTVDATPGDGVAEDAAGETSLRAAIMEANALAGADSITLAAGTYTLSIAGTGDDTTLTGDLDITSELTIAGLGAGATFIDGGGIDRVFDVKFGGNATITGLTVQNGSEAFGGGIQITGGGAGGQLNLDRVSVRNNTASVSGGGIFTNGRITLTNVDISNNTTGGTGGGLSNDQQATLTGVTISGNTATDGAGIYNSNQGVLLSLENVTISGNTATTDGGGIYTAELATLTNVTIASNQGGGIYVSPGPGEVELKNSILADNTGGNANTALTSQGYNIDSDGTAGLSFTGDQSGVDPLLGPLRDNGGFAATHALLGGSPAIDAGDNSVGVTTDQRGIVRPLDGDGDTTATVDIGAFEYTPGSIGAVNEFLVNDGHQTGIQETSGEVAHSQRAVAVADDGSYVVVWSSEGQDAFGWGVYAQRFDKFGAELTGEILVNEVQTGNEQWARVASDGGGNFVVTWTSGHSGSFDVYARRFDSSGSALGGEFRVNTTTAGSQKDSSIAMDAFGNFVVVWEGQGSVDPAGVFYRRFYADGTDMDATEVRVNQFAAGADEDASVAMSAAGDFVVVWIKNAEIRYRMFEKDGTVGAGGIVYAGPHASSPDVAMDAQGNFVAVYRWNDSWGRGTWGHKFDSSGTEQTPWFRIGPANNNNDNRDHDNPSISMDDFGNFIVTYESVAEGEPGDKTVFAERFLADKTSLGRFQVNQTTAGDQHMASIAMLNLDNHVVAFTGQDADQSGVFVRQYGTATLNNPGTVTIDNTTPANGDTLAASVSDADGATGAINYQWYRDGTAIAGATSSTYTTVPADVGTAITVTATYTDDLGNGESLASTPTAAVTGVNQTPVVNDQTLSVDENAANGTLVGAVAATDNGPADNYTMLYWVDVQTDELRRVNLDGTGNQQLAIQFDGTAATGMRSVAVDDVNGKVYWVNNDSDQIWRANLDGSSPEPILSGIAWPMGIAVDAAGEKIYWFDNNAGELWWADPDGANAAALITAGISHPKALAIDAGGGKLYWTDWGLNSVMRANLDGSNLETVVTGLDDPYGIALDTDAGKVYWAEALLGEIQRAGMVVGATAETVVSGLSEPRAVAVDTINGKVYYNDAGTDRIERANLDGSAIEIVTATGDWPIGLAIGPPVQNLTHAITGGNTNGAFAIDSVTGAITVANSTELNFETTPVFNLTVTVTDAGGLADSATVTVNLTDINEPPTVVTNTPLDVLEEATTTITSAYLETTDPDTSPDQIVYTLTMLPAGGSVRLSGTSLTLGQTFTQDDINNNRVTYRDSGSGDTTSFQITVSDGNTTLPAFSFNINGQPINDAPVVTAPGSALNATEQVGLAIQGTGFGVSDPDEAGAGALATLTVGQGTISVVAGDSGVSVDSGDGTGFVTLSGSIAQLNALLTGTSTGTITYLNNSDTPSASTTLTVTVNDQGNTGSDPGLTGDASSEEGSNSVTMNIASVNDPPTINSFAGYGVNEDDNYRALPGISIDDVDAGGGIVQVTLSVADGVLNIGSTAGLTSLSGNDSASVVIEGSIVDINGALATLSYKPNPDFAGNDNLSITVDDLGNTGTGGPQTANKIVPLTVNPINDAPVLGNNNLTIDEGGSVILDSGNLSATDVDNADGGLTFNISAVTAGHFERVSTGLVMTVFTQDDITAGEVRFVHDGSQNAPGYSVTVTDGSANVGPAPAVITFNAINDPGAVAIDNMNPAQGDTLTAGVSDPDGATGAVSYQWYRDGVAIAGANSSTYTTVQADVGLTITVTATYTDDLGSAESPTSAATAAVTNINDPGAVAIDNMSPAQGDTLSAGVTDPDGATGAISYQWYRGGVAIAGANASTYTTVQADVGSAITVTAAYTDDLGSAESLISAATAAVTNVNDPGAVAIDNMSPAQGDTLTAGVTDPDGATGAISFQWYRGGVAIAGANASTYTTVQADVGSAITVTAAYSDDLGSAESLISAATAPVTNVNNAPVAVNDHLSVAEDNSITFASAAVLLGNDSDVDGDTLTMSGITQPANGTLVDNGDGSLTYTPDGDFYGTDSFTYSISDGNGGTASGTAMIVVAPVGDTPRVTDGSTFSGIQSELIFVESNAHDGAEVTHFRISGITNGSLYLADGVTRVENGDFISAAQGQAGLRFTPAENSLADGSFNVEASEDGVSVASQSGIATSNITVMAPVPPPPEPHDDPVENPDPEQNGIEEQTPEENQVAEDVPSETEVQAEQETLVSVAVPEEPIITTTAKPDSSPRVSDHDRPEFERIDDRTIASSKQLFPQPLKMLLEAKTVDELKTALAKLDVTTLSPEGYALVRNSLDAIKEEIGKEIMIGKTVVGSVIATSVGLSAGYVVWLLKGGSLMASVLSSLPAWQFTDPLAILVSKKKDQDDDDDESLETIIEDGAGRKGRKERRASNLDKIKKESAER